MLVSTVSFARPQSSRSEHNGRFHVTETKHPLKVLYGKMIEYNFKYENDLSLDTCTVGGWLTIKIYKIEFITYV